MADQGYVCSVVAWPCPAMPCVVTRLQPVRSHAVHYGVMLQGQALLHLEGQASIHPCQPRYYLGRMRYCLRSFGCFSLWGQFQPHEYGAWPLNNVLFDGTATLAMPQGGRLLGFGRQLPHPPPTNRWPEAPWGGGVVGVLGPAESPPPPRGAMLWAAVLSVYRAPALVDILPSCKMKQIQQVADELEQAPLLALSASSYTNCTMLAH